jgi:hypothetical protein
LTQQIAVLLAARLEFTQQCLALVGEPAVQWVRWS